MSPEPNRLARSVAPSATMAAAAAGSRHPDPIPLTVGEPAELPPPEAVEAARRALAEGRTRYGPAAGLGGLRASLAAEFCERTGRTASSENVIVTVGGKGALMGALRCILEPGDAVALLAPYWPTFADQAAWCGARPLILPPGGDGLPDPAELDAALAADGQVRVLVLNSPSNPTGRVLEAERIEALVEVARSHDLWILSDEVYRTFVFEGEATSPARYAWDEGRVVVIESFSKRFSMTGYRVGAAIAPAELVGAMTRLAQAATTHTCTASQHAALAALEVGPAWDAAQRQRYRARRDRAHAALSALPDVRCARPEGAFYLLPDVTGWVRRRGLAGVGELADELRHEDGLLVTPGGAFGAPGHLRLSLGLDDARLDEALERLGVAAQRA